MTIWSHEDPVPGIFNDGAFPVDRPVLVRQRMGELVIAEKSSGEVLARWPLGTLRPVPDADYPATLRLRQGDGEGGRLAVFDRAFNEGLTEWWPGLRRGLVYDRAALRAAGRVSLGAIFGIGLFFLALLPVLGQFAAYMVPLGVERRVASVFRNHGDEKIARIEAARSCDTASVSHIVDKLVEPLRKASGWPGSIRIRVIDNDIPQAASIPGGEIVIFDGLLRFARSADEVAGVLAHEIGHVTERHAVRNLFVTSFNFFGFDQLLGNFSGQLVVHPVSGFILNRREGRRAEREADRSAVELLKKAGFKVRPLADFLDRVAYLQGDDAVLRGWLSTHPLSRTRSRRIRDAAPAKAAPSVLTAAEFSQLRAICDTRIPRKTVPPGDPDTDSRAGEQTASGDRTPPAEEPVPAPFSPGPEPREDDAPAEAPGPAPDAGRKPSDLKTPDEKDRAAEDEKPASDGKAADEASEESAGEETPDLDDWDTGE